MNPPDWLDAQGAAFFRKHSKQLIENQLLTASTADGFYQCCELWSMARQAEGRQKLDAMKDWRCLAKLYRLLPTEKPNVKEDRFQDFADVGDFA
jgi:hypothetical protein